MIVKLLKTGALYAVCLSLVISPSFTASGQQLQPVSGLKLYDSFDQRLINPAKWYTQWQCGSPSVMECERDIQDGHLHLRVRAYGSNSTSDGSQFGTSGIYLSSASASEIAAQLVVAETAALP